MQKPIGGRSVLAFFSAINNLALYRGEGDHARETEMPQHSDFFIFKITETIVKERTEKKGLFFGFFNFALKLLYDFVSSQRLNFERIESAWCAKLQFNGVFRPFYLALFCFGAHRHKLINISNFRWHVLVLLVWFAVMDAKPSFYLFWCQKLKP